MAIVTIYDALDQLGLTNSTPDIFFIEKKIDAAQAHIERGLGYKIEERFPIKADIPADLKEAVLQLVAWWYDDQEGAKEPPFSITDIITAHRDWSF